jgi:hypothetical protein
MFFDSFADHKRKKKLMPALGKKLLHDCFETKATLHTFVKLTFTSKYLPIFVSKPLPSFSIVDGVLISFKVD